MYDGKIPSGLNLSVKTNLLMTNDPMNVSTL